LRAKLRITAYGGGYKSLDMSSYIVYKEYIQSKLAISPHLCAFTHFAAILLIDNSIRYTVWPIQTPLLDKS
jgi:hypothetical protein